MTGLGTSKKKKVEKYKKIKHSSLGTLTASCQKNIIFFRIFFVPLRM